MRVSPSLHGELHWSKEATASSKSPSPPTLMPPHYRPGNGKKTHMVGWHKKFGKARQLPILIHVHSTERNDGDDSTGFHDCWHVPPIFAVACVMDNLFFFIVSFPPIHMAPYISLQTFPERSRKSPFLKRSASKAFNGFSPRLHLTLPMHQWSSSCHPTGWSCPPSRKWHLPRRCRALS